MLTPTRQGTITFISMIAIIYVSAWFLQVNLILNTDVSWLLHSTSLLLAGKTYANDFFSPNPPLILFLYMPPVLFSQWLGLKIMLPFRSYIFLLITFSLVICSYLAKRIFAKEDGLLAFLFLIALSAIFLLIPRDEFGQRDCLLLVFIMPYLLLVVLRLQGDTLNQRFALAIGIFAALGFGIKPQFLAVLCLTEIYFMIYTRNWLSWIRIEVLAMLILFVLYGIALFAFFSDFIFVVTPYVLRHYYTDLGSPLVSFILFPRALFCSLPIVFYLLQYKKNPHKILSTVLVVALYGLLLSYLTQRTLFLHHIIPAFSLGVLLLTLLFGNLISRPCLKRDDYVEVVLMGVAAFIFLYHYKLGIWPLLIFSPVAFFGFFALLFAVIFYATENQNSIKILVSVSLIIAISFVLSSMALHTSTYFHFFLILILLMGLFGRFVAKINKPVIANMCIAIVGVLIFCFPWAVTGTLYQNDVINKNIVLSGLIEFMRTQASQQSIYVLAVSPIYGSPLVDYVDAKLVQRFDCLWMTLALVKLAQQEGIDDLNRYIKNNTDPDFFVNKIAEDFVRNKPSLVFVDDRKYNVDLNGNPYYFDFINRFTLNNRFNDEWRHYRYLTTLTGESYQLQIYKRILE